MPLIGTFGASEFAEILLQTHRIEESSIRTNISQHYFLETELFLWISELFSTNQHLNSGSKTIKEVGTSFDQRRLFICMKDLIMEVELNL